MSLPNVESTRGSVHTAFSLAHLLEQIDRSGAPVDAAQYQMVVSRLKDALSEALPEAALTAVLRTYPSAAELYENMHYELSGLSRSPLENSVSSEVQAVQLLARFSLDSRASGN
ncbi:MAG: hypothetical protein QFE16_04050 [Pseudomonadota bacterium]|nr:hypothetical protein [Pseudomonadota bacterium]